MSLVYMFVCVSRRLGVQSSPTNFPGKVLCHISPVDPTANEMLFDMTGDSRPFVFSSREVPRMMMDIGLPPDAREDLIRPCRMSTILFRAAANIHVAFRWSQRRVFNSFSETVAWCNYATFCIFILQSQEHQMLAHIVDSKPLDALAVLMDVLCPALVPRTRANLERHCADLVQAYEDFAAKAWLRSEHSVDFFVGLVVRHGQHEYVGCIIGWHPLCLVKEDLTPIMEVQRLARGWSQPFYWIITVDGAKRYVAEEDLSPVVLSKDIARRMFEGHTVLGRYFEGAQENEVHQRGRLLPSQELKTLYPEDDLAGALWVSDGRPERSVDVSTVDALACSIGQFSIQ